MVICHNQVDTFHTPEDAVAGAAIFMNNTGGLKNNKRNISRRDVLGKSVMLKTSSLINYGRGLP